MSHFSSIDLSLPCTEPSTAAVQRQRKLASAIEQGAARIVLVRHGETDWNVSKRLQGQWTGDPAPQLTGDGHAQAERLADHLKGAHPSAECIISSDLLRATQVR